MFGKVYSSNVLRSHKAEAAQLPSHWGTVHLTNTFNLEALEASTSDCFYKFPYQSVLFSFYRYFYRLWAPPNTLNQFCHLASALCSTEPVSALLQLLSWNTYLGVHVNFYYVRMSFTLSPWPHITMNNWLLYGFAVNVFFLAPFPHHSRQSLLPRPDGPQPQALRCYVLLLRGKVPS